MSDAYNMTETRHNFSKSNKIGRVVWSIGYLLLFRPFSIRIFRKWRIFVLRLFGAKVSYKSIVHANVKIWAPWNLEVGDYSCVGQKVDCYNQGRITLGNNVTISQKCYLCASSHDYTSKSHDLFLAPIVIEDKSWVAADAFIGPGVTIGKGAVIGARAAVFKSVEQWSVVGGNPAKFIKTRKIKD
ncbi:putative colanic acid biosynthesis acetyltransferase WcaF [Zobellia uliginosa]|uniref:Colanic acid biosynthesis acetyltransferase WcaF n=1 Tax=Zobellia uliginosa TaxID=143224 RepID=A0ABY1KJT7_9FLAO|nr:putative colanic acid biosynthesis acetyltransferase [Zobellia uliginosa]SIS42645.1 putative colanic acid biosynthesis acetyltransferase WcaF [Zobellia uliginosa]